MNRKLLGLPVLCASLCLAGCLGPRVNYDGESFPATNDVAILKSGADLPKYVVIGRCSVSGSYNSYSFEQLTDRLCRKAESVGADAIYIKNRTVVKTGEEREDQLMNTSPDDPVQMDDDSAGNMELLDRRFTTISTAFTAPQPNSDVPIYKRVEQALFLKKKTR